MTDAPDPSPHRPTWSEVRAALDAAGFHPSRRLGQNFLLDDNTVARIADDARLSPGDFVLEVGAGCGFLTSHLASRGVELVSVEIDRRLFEIASRFVAPWSSVRLIRADVLAAKTRLAPEVEAALPADERPWHLVGNLPYSIASPLLALLARRSRPPRSMTALVQAEVAARIAATPGTKDWGPLTVRLQAGYRAQLLRTVGAALFWPKPRVESAVVRLERRPEAELATVPAELDPLVELLFGQRRKAVLGLLARALGGRERAAALLAHLGVAPSARAEDLDLPSLAALAASSAWVERPRSGRGGEGGTPPPRPPGSENPTL